MRERLTEQTVPTGSYMMTVLVEQAEFNDPVVGLVVRGEVTWMHGPEAQNLAETLEAAAAMAATSSGCDPIQPVYDRSGD